MSFKKFLASKKTLSNPKEIRAFFKEKGDDPLEAFKLHVYEDSYYIVERKDGTFCVPLPIDEFTGSLADCEKELYDWDH